VHAMTAQGMGAMELLRLLASMLAAAARKDYEDRRRRQAQGIAKAGLKRTDPTAAVRRECWHCGDAAFRHVLVRRPGRL
jgi:DNA invertase Pin-like site-specific DNA recombinase